MSTLKRIVAGFAVCFVALACNQEELNSLMNSSNEQAGVIASINEQIDNINATIDDLKATDTAIGQAISSLQEEDVAIREQLETDKSKIEASIDSLGNYLNEKLKEAQDWAMATFATLDQFQHLCDSVAAVRQSLEALDVRITAQLKHDLDSLEISMKVWVNEQLAGYYTIAQMDAKLAALEKSVQDGDKANADAITQLQSDLEKQATDLTTAYQAAIASAIEESNGVINEKIATEITTVNTRITNEVKALADRIDALELRLQAVEDYINSQKGFTISFTMPKDTVCFPGETITVGYEVSESTLPTVIECIPDEGWKATVQSNGNKGTIAITAPAAGGNGKVIVLANRSSWTLMSSISLEEGILRIAKNEYPAPAQGGQLSIPFSINANYGIKIAPADTSWIHLVETKAALRNENLLLTIAANPNQSIRVGKVYIYPEEGSNDQYYELKINQASAFFSVSTTGFVVGGDVTSKEVTVTSSLPFNLDIPAAAADWLSATCTLDEGTTYKITTNFTANNGENRRTADLGFVSTDGSTRYGSVAIVQDTRSEEDISTMIFEVRATIVNDYTVYLPISIVKGIEEYSYQTNAEIDCYIDWGDGTTNHYLSDNDHDSWISYVSHKYANISEATSFIVRISGKVQSLCSEYISRSNRNTIVRVIQWGQTGLVSIGKAFQYHTALVSIPTDDSRSFENVLSLSCAFDHSGITAIPENLFYYATKVQHCEAIFRGCDKIHSIPEGLFASCRDALYFTYVFYDCSEIESIPSSLFANCASAQSFAYAFNGCSAITTIPSSLFADCSSAISYAAVFLGCSSITTIPEGLFSSSPNAELFGSAFMNCYALTGIPPSLFDNNRKVIHLENCFYGCGAVNGESPYTIIQGDKVHLYERINYVDEFIAPLNSGRCFWGCISLTDVANIPLSWR